MASRSRLGFYASLLVITGCFGSGGGGGCDFSSSNGLAGNGSFHYECVGDGLDPECDGRTFNLTVEGQLPTRSIARTATFDITFLDSPGATVQTASPAAVSGRGPFVAERAGTIGFFVNAQNGTDDIEDAIRLRVGEPDLVRISRAGLAMLGDERLSVGRSQRFRVTASERGAVLVGALRGTWEAEPEGIVDVETDRFGAATVRGVAPGKVRLRVQALGLADSIVIDVARSAFDFDAGSDGSADGGTDAGTDADGGSTDASQD